MRTINACPICASAEHTPIAAYNGLIMVESLRHTPKARYDYVLCHQCGLVYARHRPVGEEFDYLLAHFNDYLGQTEESIDLCHRPGPLSEETKRELLRRIEAGWLKSEDKEPTSDQWLPTFLKDRVREAYHLDFIASLVPLRGARVVEMRSKTGFLPAALRQHFGAAEAYVVPMFATQRFLMNQVYKLPETDFLDFENLTIPVPGDFDLIIAKHMFTHALYPERLFEVLRERLKPGGWIYLYSEYDDRALFAKQKNLFTDLRCFHFQQFDLPTLARCVRRQGFEPRFIRRPAPRGSADEIVCLAQRDPNAKFEPMTVEERTARLAMYQEWSDLSILSCPKDVRGLFQEELGDVRRRALAAGYAFRFLGSVVPDRKLRMLHAEGYAAVNKGSKAVHAPKPLAGPKRKARFWQGVRHLLGR